MHAKIEEILAVLAYSRRTQAALILGMLCFAGMLAFGALFSARFELHGVLAPLTSVVREQLLGRYEGAAWAVLGGFLMAAATSYRKDYKRLMG